MLTVDKHPNSFNSNLVSNGITAAGKQQMFEAFQSWALKTYGDTGKTKTVTRRKYNRIVRILTGEEESTTENSKFRFWVKAKGFKLGPGTVEGRVQNVLYVPVKQTVGVNHFILFSITCSYNHWYLFLVIYALLYSVQNKTVVFTWSYKCICQFI